MKILGFQCIVTFLRHFNSLLTIDDHTVALMFGENILATKTLEAVKAKMLFRLMFSLIEHQLIKIFDKNIMLVFILIGLPPLG